jgi:hypothetical protein
VTQEKISHVTAACLMQAASFLAACSRPAITVSARSSMEELSTALSELVASAELFGCKPSFWRWAADAAAHLGKSADAEKYRNRFNGAA